MIHITTARALVRAICENPDDDTPRWVYSDWLDEHDESEQADYIRLSLQLHPRIQAIRTERRCSHKEALKRVRKEYPAEMQRAEDLLQKFKQEWLGPFGGLATRRSAKAHWLCERGLVSGVTLTTEKFMRHADVLFRHFPIVRVRLLIRPPYFAHDLERPNTRIHLGYGQRYLTDAALVSRRPATDLVPGPIFAQLTNINMVIQFDGARATVARVPGRPERDAGSLAVSRAAVAYGRAQAGLSPLAWRAPT